jgi:hypothetical protein
MPPASTVSARHRGLRIVLWIREFSHPACRRTTTPNSRRTGNHSGALQVPRRLVARESVGRNTPVQLGSERCTLGIREGRSALPAGAQLCSTTVRGAVRAGFGRGGDERRARSMNTSMAVTAMERSGRNRHSKNKPPIFSSCFSDWPASQRVTAQCANPRGQIPYSLTSQH